MAEAGRTLAGRYRLAEVIGRGGMGTVYRAEDLVLGRAVAVKVLPSPVADADPANVARFEREARAAAALNHPAVVAVYDAGDDAATRFIVMELAAGRSLEAMIREDGPLDGRHAAAIGATVADALAAAHRAGIVHRDIKPANVMVAEDGSVKVLDFGIARAMDGTALTQNASVVGTAAYMSPEQALGEPVDQRSDIYSLGCVLYALLTGGPPFKGDGVAAVLNQHANVEPRPLNGRIPPALAALVMRMLKKAPADRPQSAAEVRDELLGVRTGRRTPRPAAAAVPPVGPAGATGATRPLPGATGATRPLPGATGVTRPRSVDSGRDRRLIGAWAALIALLALFAIAIAALASSGGSPQKRTAGHRVAAAAPKRKHRAAASTTTSTTSSTTAGSVHHAPLTVAQAAGALTSLITSDVQSGSIDQQAQQQISNSMSDILHSYDMGNTQDVQHKLMALDQQVVQLEQHGDITGAATPGINRAIGQFAAALARNPAPAGATGQGGPPGPPGHGGGPPGQTKKHQDQGQGNSGGDGGDGGD